MVAGGGGDGSKGEEDGIKDDAQVSRVLLGELENPGESADTDDFSVGCDMFEVL